VLAPAIATGRHNASASGTSTLGLLFGGTHTSTSPRCSNATEEFTSAVSTRSVDVS